MAADRHAVSHEGYPVGLAYASLGLGIPISAVAGGTAGVVGLVVAWAGIAAVNIAAVIGARRRGT